MITSDACGVRRTFGKDARIYKIIIKLKKKMRANSPKADLIFDKF